MKGAVIATNQDNELCHKTMEIFATVSHCLISFDLIFLLRYNDSSFIVLLYLIASFAELCYLYIFLPSSTVLAFTVFVVVVVVVVDTNASFLFFIYP